MKAIIASTHHSGSTMLALADLGGLITLKEIHSGLTCRVKERLMPQSNAPKTDFVPVPEGAEGREYFSRDSLGAEFNDLCTSRIGRAR
jgi:hypothetical protein